MKCSDWPNRIWVLIGDWPCRICLFRQQDRTTLLTVKQWAVIKYVEILNTTLLCVTKTEFTTCRRVSYQSILCRNFASSREQTTFSLKVSYWVWINAEVWLKCISPINCIIIFSFHTFQLLGGSVTVPTSILFSTPVGHIQVHNFGSMQGN